MSISAHATGGGTLLRTRMSERGKKRRHPTAMTLDRTEESNDTFTPAQRPHAGHQHQRSITGRPRSGHQQWSMDGKTPSISRDMNSLADVWLAARHQSLSRIGYVIDSSRTRTPGPARTVYGQACYCGKLGPRMRELRTYNTSAVRRG